MYLEGPTNLWYLEAPGNLFLKQLRKAYVLIGKKTPPLGHPPVASVYLSECSMLVSKLPSRGNL